MGNKRLRALIERLLGTRKTIPDDSKPVDQKPETVLTPARSENILSPARDLWDAGEREAALQSALLALEPVSNFHIKRLLVELAKQESDGFALAVAEARDARTDGPDAGMITLLDVYLALERTDAVEALVARAVSADAAGGEAILPLINLAMRLGRGGQWELANRAMKRAADIQLQAHRTGWGDGGTTISRWSKLEKLCVEEGRKPEAEMARGLAQSFRANDYPGAMLNHADVYFDAGYVDEGISLFRRACQLRPTNATGWMMLIKCLSQTGRNDEASAALESAVYAMEEQEFARQLFGKAASAVPSGLSGFDAIIIQREAGNRLINPVH